MSDEEKTKSNLEPINKNPKFNKSKKYINNKKTKNTNEVIIVANNVNGINSKLNSQKTLLESQTPEIVMLQETKLKM